MSARFIACLMTVALLAGCSKPADLAGLHRALIAMRDAERHEAKEDFERATRQARHQLELVRGEAPANVVAQCDAALSAADTANAAWKDLYDTEDVDDGLKMLAKLGVRPGQDEIANADPTGDTGVADAPDYGAYPHYSQEWIEQGLKVLDGKLGPAIAATEMR